MAIFSSFLTPDRFGGNERTCAELESSYERHVNTAWHYDVQNKRRAESIQKAEKVMAQMKKKRCPRTVGDVFDEIGAALNTPRKLWDPYRKPRSQKKILPQRHRGRRA
jgi:hypothetical protein